MVLDTVIMIINYDRHMFIVQATAQKRIHHAVLHSGSLLHILSNALACLCRTSMTKEKKEFITIYVSPTQPTLEVFLKGENNGTAHF